MKENKFRIILLLKLRREVIFLVVLFEHNLSVPIQTEPTLVQTLKDLILIFEGNLISQG